MSEFSQFNAARNRQRAAENLWGLCTGIMCDQNLNEREINFLELWLRDNEELKADPDAFDIYDCARDIVADGEFTAERRDDLLSLIGDVLQFRGHRSDHSQSAANNLLLGIIQGIMADRELNNREISSLERWLIGNESACTEWPAKMLLTKVRAITEDGIVTEEERRSLFAILDKIIPSDITKTGSASPLTITLGAEDPGKVAFPEKSFCFTGKFLTGSRSTCEALTKDRGGLVSPSITKKLNYLVLGTNVSKDWINTSFGRKIEKANQYKQSGAEIVIVTEETWAQHL